MISKNFCIAPFLQLQTSTDKKSGPCPHTANVWNSEGTLKQQWQSLELQKLRTSFLANKKDPTCHRCWKEEASGKKSLRLRLQEFRGSDNLPQKVFKKFVAKKKYINFPSILTLIPGNECNLACVSCGGNFSSKWNSLAHLDNYAPFHRVEKNYNLTDERYEEIVNNSQYLTKIELFGGEPFLNKRNRTLLLDKIMYKGTSKKIKLYFNTNGTIFDQQYMQRLTNNFRFVEIRQSIDGIGKEFEYIRYGAKFDQIMKNAEKFSKFHNTDFEIICTITLFNLVSLPKIDKVMKERGWSIFYNIAGGPGHVSINNFPETVKEKISLPQKFNDIQKYINQTPCDEQQWNRFVEYTRILDKNRGLCFKTTFPELYELVKKHGFE